MGKTFEPYEPEQALLLPPSLNDWLPEGHLARFVSDTVDQLDLSPLLKKFRQREDGRGQLAYHPRMMLKVLIFAYSQGIFSSRKIAAGVEDFVALRYLAAGNSPSHRTIARFRQENIGHFQSLFVQVVQVAVEAGLVKMGTIAIDGSKVKANASKHKAMSYGRMKAEEHRLTEEIKLITRLAQGTDEAEDEEFGPDFRGDELPEELRTREARRAKIREAMKSLEEAQSREDEDSGHGEQQQKTGKGRPRRPNGVPPDKKQRNFTDPESRVMGSPQTGFVQGYNGQIAVDAEELPGVNYIATPTTITLTHRPWGGVGGRSPPTDTGRSPDMAGPEPRSGEGLLVLGGAARSQPSSWLKRSAAFRGLCPREEGGAGGGDSPIVDKTLLG